MKMAATSQPPKKRVRLENESDVLTFYSGMDCMEDQSEVGMSFSVLKAFDKFKCRIQNVFTRKDNDYLHLELEYDSTLEALEEHKQNSEIARKKIATLENELNEAKLKLDEKDKEIENEKERLLNFGNETKELILNLQEQLESSEKRLSEKNDKLNKFEFLLRESTNELKNIHQKNQKVMEENKILKEKLEKKEIEVNFMNEKLIQIENDLPEEVLKKMYEMAKKIESLEKNKKEVKKHFSVCLLKKEKELKKLQLNNINAEDVYRDSLAQIQQKENKINELDEQLLQKNLDIERLKSRSEKIFNMLKEKDDATAKLKVEFKRHFEELSRRLAVVKRQQSPVSSPMVNQTLWSQLPNINVRVNGVTPSTGT